MCIRDELIKDATLYVTNRAQFENDVCCNKVAMLFDMLFVNAKTRPDLAEDIAVTLCGYTVNPNKHGFDGLPSELRPNQYAEFKVAMGKTLPNGKRNPINPANITVNDPSESILEKYKQFQSTFYFPLYIDGNLLVIFYVNWNQLEPFYEEGLKKINEKNKKKNVGEAASRNFSLTANKWIDNSSIAFINDDHNLVRRLLKNSGVTAQYRARIEQEL